MKTVMQKRNCVSVSTGEVKTKAIEYTAKGNRLYRFKTVPQKELEKLRVPSYSYLL
jgi:hypothetical protein